jgi:hypothetical protein
MQLINTYGSHNKLIDCMQTQLIDDCEKKRKEKKRISSVLVESFRVKLLDI